MLLIKKKFLVLIVAFFFLSIYYGPSNHCLAQQFATTPSSNNSVAFRGNIPHMEDDAISIAVTKGNSQVDHTCNAVVFSQVPGQPDFFIGRSHDYADPGVSPLCVPNSPGARLHWLSLYKMDWGTHTLNYVHDILKPPFQIEVTPDRIAQIDNVFDPSVMYFKGEVWVAFVCGGKGLHGNSSCVAPFDPATGTIHDLKRTSVVAEGSPDGQGFVYTASVPEIFAFQNKIYLYWSMIKIRLPGKPINWLGVTVRGMELAQENSGLRRLWGVGSGGAPVVTYDQNLTTEILAPDMSDATANQMVDIKGIYTDGHSIYLPASIGGYGQSNDQSCVYGLGTSYGCFRLQFFRSEIPLGQDIFNHEVLASPLPPYNPAEYVRFYNDGTGHTYMMTFYESVHHGYSYPYLVQKGILSHPFDSSVLQFVAK